MRGRGGTGGAKRKRHGGEEPRERENNKTNV